MKARNFLNIALCFILLVAFIGIPVTKGYCTMESCQKECIKKCCSPEAKTNACGESIDYIQLDSDFSYTDASVKIPDVYLFHISVIQFLENSVSMLTAKHSEFSYKDPFITTDIPVKVRCFRI